MKKIVLMFVLLLTVVGCSPSSKELVDYPLPSDLKDCKIYEISNGSSRIKIVRCPNSTTSTTYQAGKTRKTVITIDGLEYELSPKK